MPEPKRPLKVFLCHSSADKPEVRDWYKRLIADGVDAWLDVESLLPGQKWKIEIPKAIRNSDIVLVFLSEDSINKEGFVQKEIKEALDIADEKLEDAIFIIPARLEECTVPNRLGDYQWVDLFNSEGYNKLIRALEVRAKTTNATLLPAKISKIDEVKSRAIEFETLSDFSQAIEAYSELKRLEPSYSGINEKIQELELKVLKSRTAQKEERQAARKAGIAKLLSNTVPFFRIIGILGIITLLFWGGSRIIPIFIFPTATVNASLTPAKVITSTPSALKTEISDDKGVRMMLVPAGDFTMGSDDGFSDKQPAHSVSLDAFYIDKNEVTNSLYKVCVAEGVCRRPLYTNLYYASARENYPVVTVDWNMADAYCQWRGGSLPTEAQWEKAARGDEERTYPWGELAPIIQYANYKGDDAKDVGSYPSVRSPYGVLDLAGNVSEWVSDWYSPEYYQTVFLDNILNPTGPIVPPYQPSHNYYGRVFRGGSWRTINSSELSTTYRSRATPDSYADDLGFRCTKDVP